MKNVLLVLGLFCILSSCEKKTPPDTVAIPAGSILTSQGNFSSNAHPTSGMVKLYSLGNTKTLVFENFTTDEGPDLRVYLSTSTGISNSVELGALISNSGNFNYNVDSTINTTTHNYVLIWCQPFSVLFGNAVLQ